MSWACGASDCGPRKGVEYRLVEPGVGPGSWTVPWNVEHPLAFHVLTTFQVHSPRQGLEILQELATADSHLCSKRARAEKGKTWERRGSSSLLYESDVAAGDDEFVFMSLCRPMPGKLLYPAIAFDVRALAKHCGIQFRAFDLLSELQDAHVEAEMHGQPDLMVRAVADQWTERRTDAALALALRYAEVLGSEGEGEHRFNLPPLSKTTTNKSYVIERWAATFNLRMGFNRARRILGDTENEPELLVPGCVPLCCAAFYRSWYDEPWRPWPPPSPAGSKKRKRLGGLGQSSQRQVVIEAGPQWIEKRRTGSFTGWGK